MASEWAERIRAGAELAAERNKLYDELLAWPDDGVPTLEWCEKLRRYRWLCSQVPEDGIEPYKAPPLVAQQGALDGMLEQAKTRAAERGVRRIS